MRMMCERPDLHAPLPPELEECARRIKHILVSTRLSRVGVAYSGGVDSSVLAALTARALGNENTVLLLAVSPSLARRQLRRARTQAESMGLRLIEIPTFELNDPAYIANTVDRCYFCKTELFERFLDGAVADLGLDALLLGSNADDARALDRPCERSAVEHGIISPLAEAGVTKRQVRLIADALGLSSATLPASPCLASRIPHGTPVSLEALAAIDAAEEAVLDAGFSDCRVRHHGTIARIEIPVDEIALLTDHGVRKQLLRAVKAAGFSYATLDLAGMQSGAFTLEILSARGGAA